MPKTYIEEMTREQVINELRGQAHPQWFHSLLTWSTPHLKALLTYYKTSDEKTETPIAITMRPIVGLEIRAFKTCA